MNIPLQDVYDFFLSKITTYEFLDLNEEEIKLEQKMLFRKAYSKCITLKKYIKIDYELEQMIYSKEDNEDLVIDIISSFMVVEWIKPRINNIELYGQRLNSKDYSTYSQANHLKELISAKNDVNSEAHYWMNRFSWIIKGGDK